MQEHFAAPMKTSYNQIIKLASGKEQSMYSFDYLFDNSEQTTTRFVVFITPKLNRFDLAVTTTDRYYGKKLVTDLQNGITAIIGPDDLEEEGYLERVFKLDEEGAAELREFLEQVVGTISFSDL